jgi:hypothetical protein
MREIKFRAWAINAKKMYSWEQMLEQRKHFASWFMWTDMYKLMQFTGLRDKNGREIYEGDILKDTGNIRRVLYNTPSFVLVDENGFFYWTYNTDEYEVIGNVHDNPDLLREEC